MKRHGSRVMDHGLWERGTGSWATGDGRKEGRWCRALTCGWEGAQENEEDTEKEDSHAYLCNATCKDAIVDSVVGLSVKVATKCIPECAKSDYIMRTKGEPLPAWTTIDEVGGRLGAQAGRRRARGDEEEAGG